MEEASVRPASRVPAPRLSTALRGALGFGAVSLLVYGSVAFGGGWMYGALTETGAYAVWAALFLAGAPWILARLLVVPRRRLRFGLAFVGAFLVYAAVWTTVYFLRRDAVGELLASLMAPALLAVTLAIGMGFPGVAGITAVALALGHTGGYYIGRWLHDTLPAPYGMLAWGLAYGVGFGAALGWAAARLESAADASSPS